MPQANSTFSIPRATSPAASSSTLPCSLVTMAASSERLASRSWRKRNMTPARVVSDDAPQSAAAAAATFTTSSTSLVDANATSPVWVPVAGSNTGPERPEQPSLMRPSIQCPIAFMVTPLRAGTAGGCSPP